MSALGLGKATPHTSDVALGVIERSTSPLSTNLVGAGMLCLHFLTIVITGLALYFAYLGSGENWSKGEHLGAICAAGILTVSISHWSGAYHEDRALTRRWGLQSLLSAWAIAVGLLLALAFGLKISDHYSRVWAFSWFATTSVLLVVTQVVAHHYIHRLARDGRFASRTVIVGAGEHGLKLAAHLRENLDPRVQLLGFIDDRTERIPSQNAGCTVLGDCSHLVRLVQMGCVDQVFIALPWGATDRVLGLVRRLAMTPVNIRLAPDLVGFEFAGRGYSEVARLPMLRVFDRPISGWAHFVKGLEDRFLSSLALLFVAPLMALIAIAIKLDSPGPVFFQQKRLGFNNKEFSVWKFRTMYSDAEDCNAEALVTREDPRVTRVGRLLRRTSLDELPQLFNVLLGDMSLVGPRPHALAAKAAGRRYEEVVDAYAARHRVKPGITGWAQVNGWRGGTDTVEQIQRRVEHDLYYIDNWSIWLDLSILFRTCVILWKDENAY